MKLTGLHLLLTYQCTFECDHCFVWGSPRNRGAMTLRRIRRILDQAGEVGTVEWIYFEGGEPFLFYAPLLRAARNAAEMGFKTGIVTNAYWATDEEDALEFLRPFQGIVHDLSISTDLYHSDKPLAAECGYAYEAAKRLGIPVGLISIDQPGSTESPAATGQIPVGTYSVMFRGRAAETLAGKVEGKPWAEYTRCPHEDLLDPGRLHVDPNGNLHLCQGISIGNLFHTPLHEICATFDPESDPVIGPLLQSGPAELARRSGLSPDETYADACHLCYEMRKNLRERYPDTLLPDVVYGEGDKE